MTEKKRAVLLFYVPARAIQTGFVDVHDPVGQNLSLPFPKPDLALHLPGHSKPIPQSLARKKKYKTKMIKRVEGLLLSRVGSMVQKRNNCLQEKKENP